MQPSTLSSQSNGRAECSEVSYRMGPRDEDWEEDSDDDEDTDEDWDDEDEDW
jgi:hypothetical protein